MQPGRLEMIRDYIIKKGEVEVSELCAAFPSVCAMTVRRDLAKLEGDNVIIRTHGGARVNPAAIGALESFYIDRESVNTAQKNAIARKAVRFIEDRRSIYIDSGTTLMAFIRHIPANISLTALTSAPNAALDLGLRLPGCTVLLTGGRLNSKTLSCSGHGCVETLRGINVDTAFMCASGYTRGAGFTVGEFQECELKRAVVAQAERIVMLMDTSKLGVTMPYTFAAPSDIDVLVTDGEMSPEAMTSFKDKGVEVL